MTAFVDVHMDAPLILRKSDPKMRSGESNLTMCILIDLSPIGCVKFSSMLMLA